MTEEEKADKAEQEVTESKSDQVDGQSPTPQDPSKESEGPGPKPTIKPVKEKIGEDRDNLHRREDWYQRRTGGSS